MALQQTSFAFGDEQPLKPQPEKTPPAPPAAEEPRTLKPPPVVEDPSTPTASDEPVMFAWEPFPVAVRDATDLSVSVEDFATDAPVPLEDSAANAGPSASKTAIKSTRGRKSVKELSAAADLVDIPADEVLFQKQYYGIGEVAAMFHVNTSLIRFWETEFSDIRPRKNKKGDRYFTPADIKTLELIHFLLRHKKLTIEGAKEYLKANHQDGAARLELIRSLEKVKAFLLALKARL